MKKYCWLLLLCFCWKGQPKAVNPDPSPKDFQTSVVSVQTYQQAYDWLIPWNKKSLQQRNGAALVLPNQHLLTTADLVKNHTLIEIRKLGEERPYEASAALIDYAINLALLQVANPEFWEGLHPVEWGESKMGEGQVGHWKRTHEWQSLPAKVTQLFIGFRPPSQAHFPLMEVSASLKNRVQGNPLIQNNRVSGMVMQLRDSHLDAIPASFLQVFIEKAARFPYQSFPQRGFHWQRIPQETVRQYLKIDEHLKGVLVNQTFHYGTGADVLQPNDFLTAINGWPISNEGQIDHPQWGKVLFDYLLAAHAEQESLSLDVVRQGTPMTLHTQLTDFAAEQHSVPLQTVGLPPRYVLRGGLLFQELSMDFLQLWGKEWLSKAPARLRIYQQLEAALAKNKDQRLVLLTRVLPMPINIGYQDSANMIVSEINGWPIRRLEDVAHAFEHPREGFHQVRFLPSSNRALLVLPDAEMERANAQTLQRFQIPQLEQY